MIFFKSFIILILILVCFFVSIRIQAQVDLSGNWLLRRIEAPPGKFYGNGCPKQIKTDQSAEFVTFEKITDLNGDGRDFIVREKLPLDGRRVESLSGRRKQKVMSVSWNQERTILTEFIFVREPSDTARRLTSTIDQFHIDQGLLILERKTKNYLTGDEWESRATYVRQ
ncbi:MAG TPA: hypothetical protein VKR32_01975 [Puia sp.]|nr:hypothetical protein [Puia sp.]